MRIAHCIDNLGLGGAQKVVASIVRAKPEGCRHYVYAADGVLRDEVERSGATVRIIPRRLPKFDPLCVMRLAQAMRRDEIQLVHTHLFGDSLHGSIAAVLAGRLPVVTTLQISTEGLKSHQARAYPWILRSCAAGVACSNAVRRSFVVAFGQRVGPLRVIANGCEPAPPGAQEDAARLRAELGLDRDSVLLGAIGRLDPQKGFFHLMDAFGRVSRSSTQDSRLLLVGEGPLRNELEARAYEAGLGGKVLFMGYRSDVRALLGCIDVVVFSSLYEGLPVALTEAMAAARCIVATDVPGITEAVEHGREALIVPRGRPRVLAEAIGQVIADPALRARLGSEAEKRFAREFDSTGMSRRYHELYREILGARVGRARRTAPMGRIRGRTVRPPPRDRDSYGTSAATSSGESDRA